MGAGAHQAGHPVHTAQFIENRALDARRAIGFEFHAPGGVICVDGIHQAEDASADEIVQLHLVRKLAVEPFGGVLDQISVVLHEEVAIVVLTILVEQLPHLFDAELLLGFRR